MRTTATCLCATFVVLALLVATPCLALAPAHFWSLTAGGNSNDGLNSIAIVPSNGDIIATGYFDEKINFGTGALYADTTVYKGVADIWLARFNRAGQVKWAKKFGGYEIDAGVGVALDGSENIYLLAQASGTIDMGGGDLGANGQSDIVLAKYDGLGNHIWSHSYGGVGYDQPTGIVVEASGNVYISGNFPGTANFGGSDVVAVGPSDGFIAKYNASGAWQWNVVATGSGTEVVYALALDGSNNVYATGYFNGSFILPGFTALNTTGGLDVFIAKLNSAGTGQWVQKRGGTDDDIGVGIGCDAAGNFAVTGGFKGTTNLGGSSLVSAGGFDGFLAKYNTSGVHQWSLRFGTAAEIELGNSVVMNSASKIFLAATSQVDLSGAPGYGDPDALFAKYSSTGVLTWSRLVGGSGDDRADVIRVDVGDNVVVGGFFETGVDFGGGVRQSRGTSDVFLARYGVAEPAITSIKDVGNDQGRQVRITVSRSPLDDGSASQQPITEYQAFRRILPLPAASLLQRGGPQAVPSGTWEFVGSVPANNATSYRVLAPTPADSTISYGMYRTKFFVRAATANPSLFYDSPVDSGYSLDNLAPGIPSNFAYIAGNLSWNKSSAADFDYFSVYGSSINSFGSATLIDYTVAPALDVTASNYDYYWVTATDFSGNEGNPAKANKSTGVGDTPLPRVLSVSAYPNPFNPETTVRYTLPARGHVRIDIFDLRGERVATLVDRDQDAGAFTVAWRGRNDTGASVGSGVYFARLSAGGTERTYKLTLLK